MSKLWQPNPNHGKPCDLCEGTEKVQEIRVTVRNWRTLKKPQFEYECNGCFMKRFNKRKK